MWLLLGGRPGPGGIPPVPELSSALTKPPAPRVGRGVPHRYSTAAGGDGDLEALNPKNGDTARP